MKFNFSTAALPSVCPPIRLSVICFCPYIHPIISYLSVLKLWGKTRNDDTHKNSGRRIIETKNLNTKCGAVLCLMYFKQVNYCTRKLRVYSFMPWKCDVYGLQRLFNEKSSSLLALKPLTSSCFQWLETSANKIPFHMKFLREISLSAFSSRNYKMSWIVVHVASVLHIRTFWRSEESVLIKKNA